MTKRLYWISGITLLLAAIMAVILGIHRTPFQDEINDTVNKISPDSFNLIVYTDVHHDRNQIDSVDPYTYMLDTVKTITDRVSIDAIWNLGDIINGFYTTKEEAIAEIRDVTSYEDQVSPNIHRIMGNHDNNIQATYDIYKGYPQSEVLTVSEMNAVLENTRSEQREVHNNARPTDYYVDYPDVRMVCLSADDTAFQPETVEWLHHEALETDHPVLFLAHIPTRPEWGFHQDVKGGEEIEQAIRSFISAGGTVLGYIHGHDHGDIINPVMDENGNTLWSEICVGCTRFHVPKSNGTPGMTFWPRDAGDETMLLFDVVCMDLKNRHLQLIRFGAGEDREIWY